MERLPFDPERMKAPPADAEAPLSISALSARIDAALGRAFPDRVVVRGEVSGARERTHWYFNLKDEQAVIGAVMFASAAKRAAQPPRDGRVVIASGRLEYYAPQGRLSLIVDRLVEDGAGSLDARFRALCDELRGLGWFDEAAKRPLPVFPRRIAVVTSASSAALQDVLDTTRRRCPAVELVLVDVTVQGERAAAGVAAAVRAVGAAAGRLGVDAILLTRGGGSVEDLWCFNDRGLAEAVRSCPIPVVAAIGHESDTTIAELVADRRAATPTQAAMLLTPDREALRRQVDALSRRLRQGVAGRVQAERRRVGLLSTRPVLADPRQIVRLHLVRLTELDRARRGAWSARMSHLHRRLARCEVAIERRRPAAEQARRSGRLDVIDQRLRSAIEHAMRRRADRLERLAALREAIGPMAVLRRGFTVTTSSTGVLLRSATDASPGARVTTRFYDGSVESIVEGGGEALPRPLPARRPGERPEAPQLDLFAGPG